MILQWTTTFLTSYKHTIIVLLANTFSPLRVTVNVKSLNLN